MLRQLISSNKLVISYGIGLAVLLFLMQWLQFRFLVIENSLEVYVGAIAIIFTVLGIWLAQKLTKPRIKTIIVEKEVYTEKKLDFVFDNLKAEELGLSKRELEVLNAMSEGLSNQEIAEKLFVSLNTVKSHASRIFEKLGVQRRTQAIESARKLNLIP